MSEKHEIEVRVLSLAPSGYGITVLHYLAKVDTGVRVPLPAQIGTEITTKSAVIYIKVIVKI